jgi:hypothetical protein
MVRFSSMTRQQATSFTMSIMSQYAHHADVLVTAGAERGIGYFFHRFSANETVPKEINLELAFVMKRVMPYDPKNEVVLLIETHYGEKGESVVHSVKLHRDMVRRLNA